jgi:hypothetical protein
VVSLEMEHLIKDLAVESVATQQPIQPQAAAVAVLVVLVQIQ